jgi:glycosyltransferase involved in cell wall biosynthesis
VPPGDVVAMARAWQKLLADAPRRAQLGRAGRLSVEKEFSAGKMATRFLEIATRVVRVPASA